MLATLVKIVSQTVMRKKKNPMSSIQIKKRKPIMIQYFIKNLKMWFANKK